MGSDHISEKPLPPEQKRCSQCGQLAAPNAEMCWLCLEKFSVQEGASPPRAPAAKSSVFHDEFGWILFAVIAIMLIAVFAIEAPGVLLILVVLPVPALIRTQIMRDRAEAVSLKQSTIANFVAIFFSSLGISALIGLVAAAAFFVVCIPTGFGTFAVTNSIEGGLTCGIGLGLLAGISIFVVLFRKFLK